MIRFMSDTRYAGLEKEMQHIQAYTKTLKPQLQ